MFFTPLMLGLILPMQELKAIPSTMERVTVYNGKALVERSFNVHAAEVGLVSFEIFPLPILAENSSVQIRLKSGAAVMQGLEVRQRVGHAMEGTKRDELRLRVDRLNAERRDHAAGKAAIQAGQGYVEAIIQAVAQGEILDETVFTFVQEKSSELDKKLARWEARDRELQAEIEDLRLQLGKVGQETRPFKVVQAMVHFESPGEAIFELSYIVSRAWWKPSYDVRVLPDLTGVSVELVAQVNQRTDEDWEDVTLLLSTAAPQRLNPPELPQRWINLPPEPGSIGTDLALQESELESLGIERDRAPATAGGRFGGRAGGGKAFFAAPEVTVQGFGLTHHFILPVKKTIRSDGELVRLPLRKMPLAVEPERYLVPSVSEKAFLRADVVLTGDAPFLAGPAKIYLGPDYLGEAAFKIMRPGDSTTLDLGIDPNLTLKYELIKDERDDPGFLSSTVHLTRLYRTVIKLSSDAQGPVTILVEDVLPISNDDRVEVSAVQLNPAPLDDEDSMKLREEKGVYRWRIQMSPGASQNIFWGYEVAFDKDLHPVFLEN